MDQSCVQREQGQGQPNILTDLQSVCWGGGAAEEEPQRQQWRRPRLFAGYGANVSNGLVLIRGICIEERSFCGAPSRSSADHIYRNLRVALSRKKSRPAINAITRLQFERFVAKAARHLQPFRRPQMSPLFVAPDRLLPQKNSDMTEAPQTTPRLASALMLDKCGSSHGGQDRPLDGGSSFAL